MDAIKAASFLPDTAVLELTYRCNQNCFFCSCPWESPRGGFDRRPELDTAAWVETISQLCRAGVCQFAFTGGEPLLRPDLAEILAHAHNCLATHIDTVGGELQATEAPPKLYLLSNGQLVDRPLLEFCRNHGVQLSMSLPGLETYPEHAGSGHADAILARFSAAREVGLNAVANITVTKKNLFELEATISAALLAGAEQVLLNRFMPGGRGLGHADQVLSSAEVRLMLRKAESVLAESGRWGSTGAEIPRCILGDETFPHIKVGTRCSAAVSFFVIDPSGYVRVCNHSPERLVHIRDWPELKKNEYWRRFARKEYLPEPCFDCQLIHECDGGCREVGHIVHGVIDAPDPLIEIVESVPAT